MLRIKLTDKKFLNRIYGAIGFIGSIASIVALAISLPGWWKLLSILFVAAPIIAIIVIYRRAENKKSASFKINQIEINVKEGDIFKEEEGSINVIPFNEYYDVIVDNVIIAENSLHGVYIKQKWNGREDELNARIQSDPVLSKYKTHLNEKRSVGNKQKYILGSVVCVDKFVLTALSHFTDENKAYLSYSDYIEFLGSFWRHIDEVYANRTINIPVFGSGITRIDSKRPTMQKLIETILWSIKDSDFQGKRINILIYKGDLEKVDFYHLEPTLY